MIEILMRCQRFDKDDALGPIARERERSQKELAAKLKQRKKIRAAPIVIAYTPPEPIVPDGNIGLHPLKNVGIPDWLKKDVEDVEH